MSTIKLNDLFANIEKLAEKVHNSWWYEKKKQGFHAPLDCEQWASTNNKFDKICPYCHSDMYPYEELPDNVKEYDRVTVRTVLSAIKDIGK